MISELQNLVPLQKGGQKEVYTADHPSLGRVVYKRIFQKADSLERTRREVRAVSLLNSPHVPRIFAHNCNEPSAPFLWIVEQYISGHTLRETLNIGRRYNISEVVNFINTMLDIAVGTEQKQLVHRDIKPENIMVDSTVQFWLLDFGIARHLDLESITPTAAPFGLFTLGYASSEQFRNFKRDIDVRTDLFSIGVVAHEMVTGINPFRHGTNDPIMILRRMEQVNLPVTRITGDTQFQLSAFINLIGDIRRTRRPRSAEEAKVIFNNVKTTLKLA
jgi:serine/threonine-protein kinase